MKTEIKINVVSVILILLIFFLLGYSINAHKLTNKEKRALRDTISFHQHKVDSLTKEIARYDAAMVSLGTVVSDNSEEISAKDRKIASLRKQLREAGKKDTIPSSEKYDILMIHAGFDSLPKPYAFSGRQIDTLYRDNEMLGLALDAMNIYEDYVGILNSDAESRQQFIAIQDSVISTLNERDSEKDIIITNKNKQLQDAKKGGKRAKILNWVIGGIATVVTYIAITK